MKDYLKKLTEFLVIGLVITLVWQAYELLFIGEIKPNAFDTLIAIVLACSIVTIRSQNKQMNLQDKLLNTYRKNKERAEKLITSQNETIKEQTEIIDLLNKQYKKSRIREQ